MRVVMRSGGCGHIKPDFGRSGLRRCVDYHRAHLERLNRGRKVRRGVLETCLKLEDELDVETVLLLRAKARRSVRSEMASRFAAEDWLGWMLVGRSGGDYDGDNGDMANDIRAAVEGLQEAQEDSYQSLDGMLSSAGVDSSSSLDKAAAAASSWTEAILRVRISALVLSVVAAEDALEINLSVREVCLRVEVDSAFKSYFADARIGSFVLDDGRIHYIRPLSGKVVDDEEDVGSSGTFLLPSAAFLEKTPSIFELDALAERNTELEEEKKKLPRAPALSVSFKAVDKAQTAVIRIPGLAMHLDVARLSPLLALYAKMAEKGCGLFSSGKKNDGRDALPLIIASTADALDASLPRSASSVNVDKAGAASGRSASYINLNSRNHQKVGKQFASPDWIQRLVVSVRVDTFRLIVSSGLAVRDAACESRDGLALDITQLEIVIYPFDAAPSLKGSLSFDSSLRACCMANDTFGGAEVEGATASSEELRSGVKSVIDEEGFIRLLSVGEPILECTKLSLSSHGDKSVTLASSGVLTARVWDAEVESLSVLLRSVFEELSAELTVQGDKKYLISTSSAFSCTPFTASAWGRFHNSEAGVSVDERPDERLSFERFRVDLPGFSLRVLIGMEPPVSVLVAWIRGFRFDVDLVEEGKFSLEAQRFSLTEEKNGGKINVGPCRGKTAVGLSVLSSMCDVTEATAGRAISARKTVIYISDSEFCVKRESLRFLFETLSGVVAMVREIATRDIGTESAVDTRAEACTEKPLPSKSKHDLELHMSCFRLTVEDGTFSSTAVFTGIYLSVLDEQLAGNVNTLELLDAAGSSGLHSSVISRREKVRGALSRAQHALRFDSGPTHFDLHLSSMNVVLLRVFIENLVQSLQGAIAEGTSGMSQLLDLLSDSGETVDNSVSAAGSSGGGHGGQKFVMNIFGSCLLFVLPIDAEDPRTVGIDAPELKVTWDSSSIVIVGRQLAVSTSSLTSKSAQTHGWHPIIPSLDLSVSRSIVQETENDLEATVSSPDKASRCIEEWRLDVKQRFPVFLKRRQIATLTSVLEQNLLFAPDLEPQPISGEFGLYASPSICSSDSLEVFAVDKELNHTKYSRTVFSFETPGVAITIFEADDDVGSSPGIGLFSIGSLRFTSDVVAESRAGYPEKSIVVTVFKLDVSSLQAEDRRPGVLEVCRLVLNADLSEDGNNLEQDWLNLPAFCVKYHQKQADGVSESKTEVRLLSPQLLFRADFIDAVLGFFSMPSDVEEFSANLGDDASASVSEDSDESGSGIPARKVSVVIEFPQLFILESPLTTDSRGVELSCDQIKASVLLNSKGALVGGSRIRIRCLELALCPAQSFSGEESGSEAGRNDALQTRMSLPVGKVAAKSLSLVPEVMRRHSMGTTDEHRSSVLKRWANDMQDPVTLFRVKLVHISPPTVSSDAVQIAVPVVTVNGTVQDIATFAVVFANLGLFSSSELPDAGDPDPDTGSAPGLPSIVGCVGSIELIVRIPQHRLRDMRLRAGGDGASLLRGKFGFNASISQNADAMEFELISRGLRCYDGQSGVWDRRDVVEPFTLCIAIRFASTTALHVDIVAPVRVNLGPLSVKTAVHCSFAMGAAFREAQPANWRHKSPQTFDLDAVVTKTKKKLVLNLDGSFAGLEICAISENLRVRAAITDVQVRAFFPSENSGEFVLHIGAIVVKNEALGSRNVDNGRDWSIILSAGHDIEHNTQKENFLPLLSGPDKIVAWRPQPVEFAAEGGQLVPSGGDRASKSVTAHGRKLSQSIPRGRRPPPGPIPVAGGVIQWGERGMRDLDVRLGLSGVDMSLDADVFSELWSWLEMVMATAKVADNLHNHPFSEQVPFRSGLERASSGGVGSPSVPSRGSPSSDVAAGLSDQRSGRVVIDTRGFRVSARAPSSTQSSARGISAWKAAELLAGSEYVSDIEFRLSKIDTDFLFTGIEKVGETLRGELVSALFSRSFLFQVARQALSLGYLARVGLLTYWRRNDTPRRRVGAPEEHRNEGLLQIMDDVRSQADHRQCIFERASMLDTSEKLKRKTVSEAATEVQDFAVYDKIAADTRTRGLVLFDYLRTTDATLRNSVDRFVSFARLSSTTDLLVTARKILVVKKTPEPVIDERLSIAQVESYSVPSWGSSRIVVKFSEFDGIGRYRQGLNMMSQFQALSAPREFIIACDSRQTAEKVRRILPAVSMVLDLPKIEED